MVAAWSHGVYTCVLLFVQMNVVHLQLTQMMSFSLSEAFKVMTSFSATTSLDQTGLANPIEHVWDLLDRRVRARAIPPRNFQELAGALVEEWGNISQQELANLVQSIRRRCTAVLNAAGGHTRYWLLLLIIIQFLLVTYLWNLFSLCQLLNLVTFK